MTVDGLTQAYHNTFLGVGRTDHVAAVCK